MKAEFIKNLPWVGAAAIAVALIYSWDRKIGFALFALLAFATIRNAMR